MNADFWDDLGRKVTGAADVLEKKTGEVVEITKLKSRQYAVERELKECYEKIGRLVYEQYQVGLSVEGNTNVIEACEVTTDKEEELKDILEQIDANKR